MSLGMPTRDFFVFCTSLLPIELRAMGALSQVRHIPEGHIIYPAGAPADTLYIVNRGLVEIVPDNPKGSIAATYLSRGDIFGDLEVLTGTPRRDLARARQSVSLQCFHSRDFPELLRRLPSFYRFLCEHLAHRMAHARDAVVAEARDLELSGNLNNFDLVTVYQTIVQSSQSGDLSIVNDEGELIAGFHFSGGQPLAGHFQHLNGEEAFWQLFLAENLRGTFSFSSGGKWSEPQVQTIAREASDMLFSALHFRDEFQALKAEMPGSAVLEGQQPDLKLSGSEFAVPDFILEEIWRCSSKRRTPLAGLFRHCSVCELKIYQAVRELVRTGHLALLAEDESQKVA
jgi:CRP-like cAMP-binding protein